MIVIFTLFLAGCSVEKNTGASRFYNSLVSRYNIWFNGNEAYKAGAKKVQSSHRDDYTTLLPVFEYSSAESARAAAPDMERAIQKASKVIAMHSITARPSEKGRRGGNARSEEFYNRREYNEWVDDAYMLMAKAHFYQRNFMAARSSFSFAVSISTDKDLATEAAIWMVRIQTEEGNYSEASRLLRETTDDPSGLPRALRAMYYTTQADIALRQKRFSDAIDPLTRAVDFTSDKDTRVRLTYLLAQVCQVAGENELSTRYFSQVIRMNPSYELEFNAGINLAGVTDISRGDADDLKKTLRRMLRDSKNKDYLDQIYYALAGLEKRMGNTDEALKLWSQAAASSTVNTRQKARAYLALGEYFYTLPEYMTASLYYDSVSALIDSRFPDYAAISRRASDLGEFADFRRVVVREDSLRRVAGMTAAERDALIAGIIRTYEADLAKGRTGDGSDRFNMGQYYENEQRYRGAISAEGGWYFYNQTALSFGRTEFRRRWGERRLEDSWRRANKARAAFSSVSQTETGDEKQKADSAGTDPQRTKEYYLRNLPLTDSLMRLSANASATALLGEGKILASRLADTLSAAISLEEAARTSTDDNIKAEALYELYRLLRLYDPARAERRRSDLLALYPETEYAQVLSDPDYVRKHREMAMRSSASYEKAYQAFTEGRYSETQALCREAVKQYAGEDLVPKFMLLDAMATGALQGEIAYKARLDSLVARFPTTAEGKRAAEINEFLRKEIPSIKIAEDTRIAEEIYHADMLQPHYVIIIAGNFRANMNQMVFDVINYNLDNYANKNYRTEGTAVDLGYIMIVTGQFGNADEAASWLRAFNPSETIRGAADAALTLYLISRDNLEKFREDKKVDRYGIFYAKEYDRIR